MGCESSTLMEEKLGEGHKIYFLIKGFAVLTRAKQAVLSESIKSSKYLKELKNIYLICSSAKYKI